MERRLPPCRHAAASYIIPQIQQIKNSSEAALAATTAQSSFVDSSKQNLQRLVFDAQEYLKGNTPPLFLRGAAFEIPVAQGRVTKLIIVAFAAFFVTIFIAFVLNAVSNIKADPQASKVISDAWRAGK